MAVGGILASRIFEKPSVRIIENLKKWHIVLIYVLGISFLFLAHKLLPGRFISLERLISGTFFAFVIIEQLKSRYSFFKADQIPFFQRAGKLTYGFYLFHCILIFYICKTFEYMGWTEQIGSFILYFMLLLVTNSLLSILSYSYFEKPLLNLKRYFRA